MYLGIDLGTSGVKAVLIDDAGELLDSATVALAVSRPQPLWSEQDPHDWWQACEQAVTALGRTQSLRKVAAIGLSGQMHGATLLDAAGTVLRPAILWNDGRCAAECEAMEQLVPAARALTGNIVMPGFTAPKLLWLQRHEAALCRRIDKVLLPKDYLRYRMTGDFASDMSDAAGTAWLDVGRRRWNDDLLAACGLTSAQMPGLHEGSDITGQLSAAVAARWGMAQVPVAAGGGDNAAGAVGVGIVRPGQAMLSLGTSGVYFVVSDGFHSNPAAAVHSFCHALPATWHLMSVMLSAASCLDWAAKLTGIRDIAKLVAAAEQSAKTATQAWFLPYLSGERTPHNNPRARGVLFGLGHDSDAAQIAQAVLEGVGFGLADGMDALHATGLQPREITLIGGGSRSHYWRQMLADILARPLTYRQGGTVGPALGAARLAQLASARGRTLDDVCPVPEQVQTYRPTAAASDYFAGRRETFKQLYRQLAPAFPAL
ncbi:xylulokinase [Exilibacterium tricleocarpae]|uniref:Xylulose kinase n=1 Tax=Exilibacterium tricleocarpae TaxID=2591008 RepID=A0A545TSD2_9GAMM|nr:xylulokinase [Exilibacterium tricleocarpae]TQV80051.1 xylulokinase [Exilibacterium tricleocarpae]